eukprot:m.240021 g.240021  ORF g.240021 m.240021 type:complete len:410 (-) comp23043_c0_seq1:68-1297(-)
MSTLETPAAPPVDLEELIANMRLLKSYEKNYVYYRDLALHLLSWKSPLTTASLWILLLLLLYFYKFLIGLSIVCVMLAFASGALLANSETNLHFSEELQAVYDLPVTPEEPHVKKEKDILWYSSNLARLDLALADFELFRSNLFDVLVLRFPFVALYVYGQVATLIAAIWMLPASLTLMVFVSVPFLCGLLFRLHFFYNAFQARELPDDPEDFFSTIPTPTAQPSPHSLASAFTSNIPSIAGAAAGSAAGPAGAGVGGSVSGRDTPIPTLGAGGLPRSASFSTFSSLQHPNARPLSQATFQSLTLTSNALPTHPATPPPSRPAATVSSSFSATTARKAVVECSGCRAKFGILRNRYYCRHCGNSFCSSCCKFKIPRSAFGATAPTAARETVRVCGECYAQLGRLVDVKD